MVCQSSKMVNYLDETVDCSKDKGGEDRGGGGFRKKFILSITNAYTFFQGKCAQLFSMLHKCRKD